VVARRSKEMLLQKIDHLQRSHDVGYVDVNLKGCRLVALGLAERNRLDQGAHDWYQTTHDWHQTTLDVFVGTVVG
uniref:hypothetical protein n=1 Tax=Agrobacterium rosae TaxID=1972867 RepID=UPI003BA01862